jgi:hypothetical protein
MFLRRVNILKPANKVTWIRYFAFINIELLFVPNNNVSPETIIIIPNKI